MLLPRSFVSVAKRLNTHESPVLKREFLHEPLRAKIVEPYLNGDGCIACCQVPTVRILDGQGAIGNPSFRGVWVATFTLDADLGVADGDQMRATIKGLGLRHKEDNKAHD